MKIVEACFIGIAWFLRQSDTHWNRTARLQNSRNTGRMVLVLTSLYASFPLLEVAQIED